MLEDDVVYFAAIAGNSVNLNRLRCATELDVNVLEALRARRLREHPVGWRYDGDRPAKSGDGAWQVPYDIADAANLTAGQRTVLGRNKYDVFGADIGGPALAREMQLLAEHVRRDERQARAGDAKSAFAIRIVIFADDGSRRYDRAAVDNRPMDLAVFANVHIR